MVTPRPRATPLLKKLKVREGVEPLDTGGDTHTHLDKVSSNARIHEERDEGNARRLSRQN